MSEIEEPSRVPAGSVCVEGRRGSRARPELKTCSMAFCSLVGADVTRTLQLREEQQGRGIQTLRCLYLCPQDFRAGSQCTLSHLQLQQLISSQITSHSSPSLAPLCSPTVLHPPQADCAGTHWVPVSHLQVFLACFALMKMLPSSFKQSGSKG